MIKHAFLLGLKSRKETGCLLGIKMEKYFDINEQKLSVRCKIYCKDLRNIKKVVVFGHGFGGHKDNKAAARFAEQTIAKYKDAAVLTFDLPCHGQDARNRLSLTDCDTYISIVLDYIRKQYTDEIYCYATSFGGYLMLKYISEHGNPFKKVALRCPALCIHESLMNRIMVKEDHLQLAKGKDALVGFDRKVKLNQAFLDELRDNDVREREFIDYADDILLIHGTKDEIIPYEGTVEFAEANVIELVTVQNADHRFSNKPHLDQAHADILKFFFK